MNNKTITFLTLLIVTLFFQNAYPHSIVAVYTSDSQGNFSASTIRQILFKIKGAQWYMDHILFPKTQTSQRIILSENSYLEIEASDDNYCDCVEKISAIRDALNYMSKNNDTIYVPIVVWNNVIFHDGNIYPDTSDIKIKIYENYEFDRPFGRPNYVTVQFGNYNNFNDISGESSVPVARLWKLHIFRSPFVQGSGKLSDSYYDYLEYCYDTGLNPIPSNTTGIDLCHFSREEIDCYLKYALDSDEHEIATGVNILYIQPFTYDGNYKSPTVNMSISLDTLTSERIESYIYSQYDMD